MQTDFQYKDTYPLQVPSVSSQTSSCYSTKGESISFTSRSEIVEPAAAAAAAVDSVTEETSVGGEGEINATNGAEEQEQKVATSDADTLEVERK
jgi:hypothetical protein